METFQVGDWVEMVDQNEESQTRGLVNGTRHRVANVHPDGDFLGFEYPGATCAIFGQDRIGFYASRFKKVDGPVDSEIRVGDMVEVVADPSPWGCHYKETNGSTRSLRVGDHIKIVEVGQTGHNGTPALRYEYFSSSLIIGTSWVRKLASASQQHTCTCPTGNFAWNGRGCTCGGV